MTGVYKIRGVAISKIPETIQGVTAPIVELNIPANTDGVGWETRWICTEERRRNYVILYTNALLDRILSSTRAGRNQLNCIISGVGINVSWISAHGCIPIPKIPEAAHILV